MLPWPLLILAFAAGFGSCFGIIYIVAKVYGQAMGAVEEAGKYW